MFYSSGRSTALANRNPLPIRTTELLELCATRNSGLERGKHGYRSCDGDLYRCIRFAGFLGVRNQRSTTVGPAPFLIRETVLRPVELCYLLSLASKLAV